MSDPALVRPAMEPVSARAPLIDDLMTWDEAARIILFECLAHASANVQPVLSTRRPEALHQLRVGLRRMRVALSIFGGDDPVLRDLNDRARDFAGSSGTARDLDVFLTELFEPAVAAMESQHGFDGLRARAEQARQRAWHNVVTDLKGPGFQRLQDDVAAAAQAYPKPDNLLLRAGAEALLDKQFKRAAKRGKHLAQKDAPQRHRLRIALKKLRYSSEFFAPLYKTKAVGDFVEPLKELQDLLGHLNDATQARTVLGRLMMEGEAHEQPELSHAAGLIQGFHQARVQRVAEKAIKRWKKFRDSDVFWH